MQPPNGSGQNRIRLVVLHKLVRDSNPGEYASIVRFTERAAGICERLRLQYEYTAQMLPNYLQWSSPV